VRLRDRGRKRITEREREREETPIVRGRETRAESETGRSPEKNQPEAKLSVEPENPLDPGGSETQENRNRDPALRRDLDPILHESSPVTVPVAVSGGSGRKSDDYQWRFSGGFSLALNKKNSLGNFLRFPFDLL